MFMELPFAVVVAKGRQAPLLTRFNAGLAAIRADGTWQQINQRSLDEPVEGDPESGRSYL
jgi:ABC-type amino acid transport substrate-binding protein